MVNAWAILQHINDTVCGVCLTCEDLRHAQSSTSPHLVGQKVGYLRCCGGWPCVSITLDILRSTGYQNCRSYTRYTGLYCGYITSGTGRQSLTWCLGGFSEGFAPAVAGMAA